MRRRRRSAASGAAAVEVAPTMILPPGTRIEVDPHGQVSISVQGNLVIQNSGRYGTLESVTGSIRIDREVEVEAVTVRCAETCFVQGRLTAWKVNARALHLEESARAHVVLQEAGRLEVGRDARLVGNFGSEGELLGLFARFAHQVRSLPAYVRGAPAELPEAGRALAVAVAEEGVPAAAAPGPAPAAPPLSELSEPLLFALVLLEREAERRIHAGPAQRALEELVKLLQEQDLETLRHTHRLLFGRIVEPREDVQRARELVAEHFGL